MSRYKNKSQNTIRKFVNSETTVTLMSSQTCDLNCKMCANPFHKSDPLTKDEWLSCVQQSLRLGVRKFVISGGEPFIDTVALEILSTMSRQKERAGFRIGITTNGIALGEDPQLLKAIKPSYIDISIDGTREEHDLLRGTGAYDGAMRGLEVCLQRFHPRSVYVCMLLTPRCVSEIPAAIDIVSRLGVENVFLQPILLTGRACDHPELIPDPEEIAAVVRTLLSYNFSGASRRMRIKLCLYRSMARAAAVVCPYVKEAMKSCYTHLNVAVPGKSIDLLIEPELTCSAYTSSIIVSTGGYVTGCCVDLGDIEIGNCEFGNVRETPLAEIPYARSEFDPCGRYD